jgi:membrane-associated phospholipid phosphatase
VVGIAVGLCISSGASAEGKRLRWQEGWPRFQLWEVALTASAFGLFAYAQWGTNPAHAPRWEGPVFIDRPLRDNLRLRTRSAREAANTASDVLWGISWSFPAVDTLMVSLALDRNTDVAWQMAMIDVQVYGVVAATTRLIHKLARRDRPLKESCKQDKDYDAACWDAAVSFYSGHTALAAASAGLTCVHHQYLPLYGGGWPDSAACATAVTTSALTGLMRILSDRHWTTDVLVGWGFGFLAGYWLPRLLHYKQAPRQRGSSEQRSGSGSMRAMIMPVASERQLGLAVSGLF